MLGTGSPINLQQQGSEGHGHREKISTSPAKTQILKQRFYETTLIIAINVYYYLCRRRGRVYHATSRCGGEFVTL
jgi:hypothetical protein